MRLGNRAGMTLTELLRVAAIVTGVPSGAYVGAKNKALALDCQTKLRQISLALMDYVFEYGRLPRAAFYPENAAKDQDSIKVILGPHGASSKLFVCPSAPQVLEDKGLTFLWNDRFSGQRQEAVPDAGKQWLLVEINAIREIPLAEMGENKPSDEMLAKLNQVPAAHPHGYNVLYVDGHVASTDKLPRIEVPRTGGPEQEEGAGSRP